MVFLWPHQCKGHSLYTHFFCETSLSFILGAHNFVKSWKECLWSVEFLVYLSEREKKSLIQARVIFSQSKSCVFSAELVSLSSLYSVSRAFPIHPPWWKINWHSDKKVRMATLSVLWSESIHSLLCSQSLHFHRQSSGKELRGKKLLLLWPWKVKRVSRKE